MGQLLSLWAPLHNDVLEKIVDFLTIDSIKNLKQVHPDFEKWIDSRYTLNVTLPVRKTDSAYKDLFSKPILQITIKESEVDEKDSEPINKAFMYKIITYKLKDLHLEYTSYASASEGDESNLIRKIFFSLFRKHHEKPLKNLTKMAVTLTPESDKIVTFRSIYKCMPNIIELKVSGILPVDYTNVHFPNLESFSYKLREYDYSNLTEYQRKKIQESRAKEISYLKLALLACPRLKYINQVQLEPHPAGAPSLDTQLSKPKPVPLVCLDVKLLPLGDEEENSEPDKEVRKIRDSSPRLPKALEEALAFKSEKAQQDGVRPDDVERVENEGQPKMASGPSRPKANQTPLGSPTLVAEAENNDDEKGKRHKKKKKKNRPEGWAKLAALMENRKQEEAEKAAGEPFVEVEYIQETPDLDPKGTMFKTFSKIFEEKKPGDLSDDLRTALGMPVGPNAQKVPPPWMIAMQRYGPPPSYPNLKIIGLNAPIPDGCSFGYHAGGWGKPTVDEQGKPLYRGVFGTADVSAYHQPVPEEINRTLWGEMKIESEEEEEEEGEETGLQEKRNERVGASMMGSMHTYDLGQKKSRASDTAIDLALNPEEVNLMDSDAMHLRAEAAMRHEQASLAKEDLCDMVTKHAEKQRSKRKRLEQKDEIK